MSKVCTICGKTSARANHVSHSKHRVPRRQNPNLQFITIDGKKRQKACSGCRRTTSKKA